MYGSVATTVEIHIRKPEKVARYGSKKKDKHPRTSGGKFRKLTNRELMERGLRKKPTQCFYVLHDDNEDSRRARMRKENLVALAAFIKHHPDRMPVWLKEFMRKKS